MPSSHGHVDAKEDEVRSHSDGWNLAVDRALANASVFGPPGKYHVTVTFSAEVDVTNPGTIQGYTVILNPS